jgi:hypothetical protein
MLEAVRTRRRLYKPLLCILTSTSQNFLCCATCMINFSAIFSEFKRLLAISSTSRQDPDITLPIISPSLLEPTSNLRDPNTSPNGIPLPPPPPSSTHADGPLPLYLGFHITSHHALGHSSSVTHPPLASPTRAHAPTNRSPPSPPLQIQDYSPSGSDISIGVNIPPPAYFSGDQPPTYSRHGNSIGPTWHMAGAQSGGFFDLASHPRSRISES